MWNSLKVIFFGEGLSKEFSNISYAVEFAFDQYRGNLLTMMKSFDEGIEKTDIIDKLTNGKFAVTHTRIKAIASKYPSYWEHNEMIFRRILTPSDLKLVYTILPLPSETIHYSANFSLFADFSDEIKRDVASYNSIIQLTVHINRDWSVIGKSVRQKLYFDKIIPIILRNLPISKETGDVPPLILLPGAGSGRLAIELASRGYRVEANECSATMICFMNKLFNDILVHNKQIDYYPFLHHQFQDDWNLELREKMVTFPFLDDSPALSDFYEIPSQSYNSDYKNSNRVDHFPAHSGSLVLQYGDFLRFYGVSDDHRQFYNLIITNFFLDTATNILDYLFTIQKILKPQGYWINIGPLHYHSKHAIPYSYHHLLEIIQSLDFTVISNEVVETSYYGEEFHTMKPEYYRIPLTVFQYHPATTSAAAVLSGLSINTEENSRLSFEEERFVKNDNQQNYEENDNSKNNIINTEEAFQRPNYVLKS
jgi:SAM-dependent methyltransferase